MSDQAKKVYKYSNKLKTVLPPKSLNNVLNEHDQTGETKSKIIAQAVDFYFANRHRQPFSTPSKNTY
jgi:hypothetical protein